MKKRIFIILIASLLLLCACQPTPDEDAVVNKAEGRLDELIVDAGPLPLYQTEPPKASPAPTEAHASPDASDVSEPTPETPPLTLQNAVSAPEHVTRSFSGRAVGDVLTVEIDAAVDVPNVTRVPVFTVRIGTPTGEKQKGMLRFLLGEGPYFRPANVERLALENLIEYEKNYVNALEAKPYGEEPPYEDMIEARLAAIQEMSLQLATLPADSQWEEAKADPGMHSIGLMNRNHAVLEMHQGQDGNAVIAYTAYEQAVFIAPMAYMRAAHSARERSALQAAGTFANGLGITDTKALGLNCADEERRLFWHTQSGVEDGIYRVSLVPVYAGIPCYSYTRYYGSDTGRSAAKAEPDYAWNPPQETISAVVQDDTVTRLDWQYPCEIVTMDNANVSLQPFDEIMETFQKQVFMNVYLDKGCPETMHVTDIRFSYLRMKKQNSEDFYLLPVWDFLGYCTDAETDDPLSRSWYDNQSFLTINAIDGSIIDRNVGY